LEHFYFCEELPLALEYGMTPHEYWDEDEDLFLAYQKAYYNRLHKQAYLQGLYNYDAQVTALANAMRDPKKTPKPYEYHSKDVYNPFNEENNKPKGYINTIDNTENNNKLYSIKKIAEERRKQQNAS
jgi:hypothetical protein